MSVAIETGGHSLQFTGLSEGWVSVEAESFGRPSFMRNQLISYVLFLLLGLSCRIGATVDLAEALDSRYVPYADWSGVITPELKSAESDEGIWWRSPEAIRSSRESGEPLSGLHLALDPGHIGGVYAAGEGRHFRINEADFFIKEGDLTLLVAGMLRERLEALGAQVSLLRENSSPVVMVEFEKQMKRAAAQVAPPDEFSLAAIKDFAGRLRKAYFHTTFVRDELLARADRVNQVIRPDAVLSLHINAAPWPENNGGLEQIALTSGDHCHVLIFGCMTQTELAAPSQLQRLRLKLTNGSGPIEAQLGAALGLALGRAFELPPSQYHGKNAIPLEIGAGYVWARNLLLLREIDCPVVLLEPFLANSVESYARLQRALRDREAERPTAANDILLAYTNAVVSALLKVYGTEAIEP